MRGIYVTFLGASLAMAASNLRASPIAFDTAGDSAYNNFDASSTTYPNGGYGWGGPWQSDGALFVNEPGLTGPGHPADTTPINSPVASDGRAWGISYFLNQNLAWAQRPLASPLLPGQTFAIDLDMRTESAFLEGDGQLVVLGSDSLESGVMLDAGPVGVYRVDVSAPDIPATYFTGVPVSDQLIHLDVEVVDNSSVRVTLTSFGSDGATASLVVPDDIPITNLTLTNQGVGYLPDAEMYFNNIQITPEPAEMAFFAGVLAATLLRRRRRARA